MPDRARGGNVGELFLCVETSPRLTALYVAGQQPGHWTVHFGARRTHSKIVPMSRVTSMGAVFLREKYGQ